MPLSPSDRALGDLLVGRRVITLPQLDEAVALAETWNVRLGDALLSRNWIEPAALLRGLRAAFRPAVRRSDATSRPIARCSPPPTPTSTRARLTMPWRRRDGRLVIATAEPGPETVLFARQHWGTAIEFVVASKFDIILAIQTRVRRRAVAPRRVSSSPSSIPEMSAQHGVHTGRR